LCEHTQAIHLPLQTSVPRYHAVRNPCLFCSRLQLTATHREGSGSWWHARPGDSLTFFKDFIQVPCAEPVREPPTAPLACLGKPLDAPHRPSLRILTYNLLADQYASQEYAKAVLFAHTREDLLDIQLRKQRILKQLINSQADVMCLQEVDEKFFERYYEPMLDAEGFSGVFTAKTGGTSDGSAVFFRRSVLRMLKSASCATLPHLLLAYSTSSAPSNLWFIRFFNN
jgi:hypothetical protein